MTEPLAPKAIEIKRIVQRIKSEDLFEQGLDFEPEHIPYVYIDNIITRVMARIVGQGPFGPVVAKCTKDGSLAVVTRGGAFDDYEKIEHDFVVLSSGTTTSLSANHLVDSGATFQTDGVAIGDTVKNTTDTTYALVTAINSEIDLTISVDIMASGENYQIIPFHEFTFAQQVTRIDIFTYDGKVDYQLTRDAVKAYGAKVELFEDSFYSLDFFTLKVKATAVTFDSSTPTRSKLMGWFREGE